MAKPLLLDTDVLIDYLRGRPEAVQYIAADCDCAVPEVIEISAEPTQDSTAWHGILQQASNFIQPGFRIPR